MLSWPLSRYQTLLSFTCLILSYWTYIYLTVSASRRRFSASKGCKPVRKWRNKDPILGLDFLWASYEAIKEHRALNVIKDNLDHLGVNTASINIMTKTFITTIEPENLKSILASDFQSYSLGEGRKRLLVPVLGEGIFTMDGKEWVLASFFFQ